MTFAQNFRNITSLLKQLEKEFRLVCKTIKHIMLALAATACASSTKMPSSVASPETNKSPAKSTATQEWRPELKAGSYSYMLHDSAFVSIGGDTTHTIPLETTIFLSLVSTPQSDSLQLVGRVDSSLRISNHQATRDTIASTGHRLLMSHAGEIVQESQPTTDCTKDPESGALHLSELVSSYPAHSIKIGDNWVDTVSTISCHGKILVSQQNIRAFQLLELTVWGEHSVAKIRRIVQATITSDPQQSSTHLAAAGTGLSSTILYVDQSTGALLQSSGESSSKLMVTTNRGTFSFNQLVYSKIDKAN